MTDKDFLESLNSIVAEVIAVGGASQDTADVLSRFVLHPGLKGVAIAQTASLICEIEIPKKDFAKVDAAHVKGFVRSQVLGALLGSIARIMDLKERLDCSAESEGPA